MSAISPHPRADGKLTFAEAKDAFLKGLLIKDAWGQSVNPFRRERNAIKRRNGIRTGRQWRKFRKAMKAAARWRRDYLARVAKREAAQEVAL